MKKVQKCPERNREVDPGKPIDHAENKAKDQPTGLLGNDGLLFQFVRL